VVAVAYQNVFHSEMYQNNIFYFLKIIFDIVHQNDLKKQKKKKFKINKK